MNYSRVSLKTGKVNKGYIINTTGSMIDMLSYQNKELVFDSISKSALKDIENIRKLTKVEELLLHNYITYYQKLGNIEYQIRQLEVNKKSLQEKRDNTIAELVKQLEVLDKNPLDILTFQDIEPYLTEIGYKNLFYLQRFGILAAGDKEEIQYVNTEQQPISIMSLLVKHKESVLSILNGNGIDKVSARNFFNQLTQNIYVDKEDTAYTQTSKLNLNDIKAQLNENGFRSLRKLQDIKVLTILEDGTIDFGKMEKLPLFEELLKDKELMINILNQPEPPLQAIIPFPFIQGVFKEIENQIKQTKKE